MTPNQEHQLVSMMYERALKYPYDKLIYELFRIREGQIHMLQEENKTLHARLIAKEDCT